MSVLIRGDSLDICVLIQLKNLAERIVGGDEKSPKAFHCLRTFSELVETKGIEPSTLRMRKALWVQFVLIFSHF